MNVASLTFAAVAVVFCSATAWSQEPAAPPADGALPAAEPATAPNPAADTPYAGIVARNMFGLVPIPPPDPTAGLPPPDPPPKITPTGIMTIFGRDQALFTAVSDKPKQGQDKKDASYVLAEGERQDDIEVIKINHESDIITFNNHGVVQELPLVAAKDSGPAAGPSTGPGRGPGVGGPGRPNMGGGAGGRGQISGFAGARQIGGGGGGGGGGIGGGGLGNSALGSGTTGVGRSGSQSQEASTAMTVDQQELLVEAQRKVLQDQGDPMARLLPPTQGESKTLVNQISGGSGSSEGGFPTP